MESIPLPLINELIMWGTVLLQLSIIPLLVLAFGPSRWTPAWLSGNAMGWAFVLALTSFIGSLYYSSIAGFAPCTLCWYQRMFIVSQFVVVGYAVYRSDGKMILPYAALLAGVGFLVSVYHNLLPVFKGSYVCEIGEVSCLADYVTGFGYITIPVMSITAFIVLLLLYRLASRQVI